MLSDAYPTPIRHLSDAYPTLSAAYPTIFDAIRLISDAYPMTIRRYPTPIRLYPTPSDANPTPIRRPSDTHLALSDSHPTPIRRRSDAIKRFAVVAMPIQRSGRQMASFLKPHGQADINGSRGVHCKAPGRAMHTPSTLNNSVILLTKRKMPNTRIQTRSS